MHLESGKAVFYFTTMVFDSEEQQKEYEYELDKMDAFKKRVLIAYELTGFRVKQACESAGVSRSAFYVWRDHDWVFKKTLEIIMEDEGDFVESKLRQMANGIYKKVMMPDPENADALIEKTDEKGNAVYTNDYAVLPNTAILIFLAKTKLKARGYVETVEQIVTTEKPLVIDWRHNVVEGDDPRL